MMKSTSSSRPKIPISTMMNAVSSKSKNKKRYKNKSKKVKNKKLLKMLE